MDGDGHHSREPERSEAAFGRNPERADADRQVEVTYRRHGAAIFRYLCHVLGSQDEAWDVLQEVFLSLLRHLRRGGKCEHARPFLMKSATRMAVRHERRWLFRRRPLQCLPAGLFSCPGFPVDLVEAVRQVYEVSDAKDRAILTARLCEELTNAEISSCLGFSLTMIQRRMRRIINRLEKRGVFLEKK